MRWSVNWHCCVAEWKKIERRAVALNENLAPRCRQSTLAQTPTRYESVGCDDGRFISPKESHTYLQMLSESSQASKTKSLTSALTLALRELMECKAPDGRYLMRHRYQWWAVYHVLVRQCGFPDGYREFVACIAQLFPEGLRVPCTESTMKQLSQTRYMEPVRDWRYDALYHGSPERFRLMRETVEWMGEMVGG